MKTKGVNFSFVNAKTNRRWYYHIPSNHRLVKQSLSSTNHPRAIFQAWMWDSNQKNQPGYTRAKPPHPHQQKPGFIAIHPRSLGQHNNHIIIEFTMISMAKQAWMPPYLSTYTVRIFPVSQSLRIYHNLKLDHQALNRDPLSRLYRISQTRDYQAQWREKHLLALLYILPFTGKDSQVH